MKKMIGIIAVAATLATAVGAPAQAAGIGPHFGNGGGGMRPAVGPHFGGGGGGMRPHFGGGHFGGGRGPGVGGLVAAGVVGAVIGATAAAVVESQTPYYYAPGF